MQDLQTWFLRHVSQIDIGLKQVHSNNTTLAVSLRHRVIYGGIDLAFVAIRGSLPHSFNMASGKRGCQKSFFVPSPSNTRLLDNDARYSSRQCVYGFAQGRHANIRARVCLIPSIWSLPKSDPVLGISKKSNPVLGQHFKNNPVLGFSLLKF